MAGIEDEIQHLERALIALNHFASTENLSQLPYVAEARFVHPRYGETTVQFVLDRLVKDQQTDVEYFLNMVFHYQEAVCKRWISSGNLAKVKGDISRFAANPRLVSDLLPEFYRAALE